MRGLFAFLLELRAANMPIMRPPISARQLPKTYVPSRHILPGGLLAGMLPLLALASCVQTTESTKTMYVNRAQLPDTQFVGPVTALPSSALAATGSLGRLNLDGLVVTAWHVASNSGRLIVGGAEHDGTGRVVAVDLATGEVTEVGRLDAAPSWLTSGHDGVVIAAAAFSDPVAVVGEAISEDLLDAVPKGPSWDHGRVLAVDSIHVWAATGALPIQGKPRTLWTTAHLTRIRLQPPVRVDTLGLLDDTRILWSEHGQMMVALAPTTLLAPFGSGAVIGRTDQSSLLVLDSALVPQTIIAWDAPDFELDRDHLTAWHALAERDEAILGIRSPEYVRRPEKLPHYTRILVESDSAIWVRTGALSRGSNVPRLPENSVRWLRVVVGGRAEAFEVPPDWLLIGFYASRAVILEGDSTIFLAAPD
ncbi:MAG: hypothetical protein RJQ04_07260 [Longimicrobiales bacterium]